MLAVAVAACSGGGGGGGEDDQGAAPTPTPTVSALATPALSAAEARELAQGALLSPDSGLLDGYEAGDPYPAQRQRFAPLYQCTQEETVDGRVAAYASTARG